MIEFAFASSPQWVAENDPDGHFIAYNFISSSQVPTRSQS
jgi:hypothetical protein